MNRPEDNSIEEMAKAVRCLALEVPGTVHDDVAARWRAVESEVERLKLIAGTISVDRVRELEAEVERLKGLLEHHCKVGAGYSEALTEAKAKLGRVEQIESFLLIDDKCEEHHVFYVADLQAAFLAGEGGTMACPSCEGEPHGVSEDCTDCNGTGSVADEGGDDG